MIQHSARHICSDQVVSVHFIFYSHFICRQCREGAAAYRSCLAGADVLHLTTKHTYNYSKCIAPNPPLCFRAAGGNLQTRLRPGVQTLALVAVR